MFLRLEPCNEPTATSLATMKRIATLVGLSVRAHLQGVTVTVTVGPGDDLAAVAANIAIAVSKGATHAHRAGVWGPKH